MELKGTEKITYISVLSLIFIFPWWILKIYQQKKLKNLKTTLKGKVVVITGASSGLGEYIARAFFQNHCRVVLCARRTHELERVSKLLKSEFKNEYDPVVIGLDLGDESSVAEAADKILKIGRVDILINNGGISSRSLALNTLLEVDKKIMEVNYFGTVGLTKALLPSMIKQQNGHVVFVSSVQGLMALPGRSSYSASKHAMQAFADSLRAEMASLGIKVTIASPGYIKTNLSLNALTGTGREHGEMDATTMSGYEPEFVARKILEAVLTEQHELVIAGFMPRIALFLRHFMPPAYHFIMKMRAKNLH